jgi:hypothetical protein
LEDDVSEADRDEEVGEDVESMESSESLGLCGEGEDAAAAMDGACGERRRQGSIATAKGRGDGRMQVRCGAFRVRVSKEGLAGSGAAVPELAAGGLRGSIYAFRRECGGKKQKKRKKQMAMAMASTRAMAPVFLQRRT